MSQQLPQQVNGNTDYETKESGMPVKLFVGQLPGHFTDADLKQLFQPYGTVTDAHVLRDRNLGTSKGCGFIGFATKEDADRAISGLHDKLCLQQGKKNLQVKYAGKDEHESSGNNNSNNNNGMEATEWKLFVGMLAKTTDEDRLKQIFEKFGPVQEVYLMRDSNRSSKGCAFIKYGSREHAVAAIAGLHEVFRDDGAPKNLTVKFAETKADRDRILKRLPQPTPNVMSPFPIMANMPYNMPLHTMQPPQATNRGEMRGPPGANVFVYNVPDQFSDADLGRLFANYGTVLSSKIFVDKLTGKPRGFGFVSYSSPSEAEMAISLLDGFDIGMKKLKVALKKPSDHGMPQQRAYAPY